MPTVSRTLAAMAISLLMSACSLSSIRTETNTSSIHDSTERTENSEIIVSTQESLQKTDASMQSAKQSGYSEAGKSSQAAPVQETGNAAVLVVEPDMEDMPETEPETYENINSFQAAVEIEADHDMHIEPETSPEAPIARVPARTIDTSGLNASMYYEPSEGFVETLLSGCDKLYYHCDTETAEASLSEVVWYYCQIPSGIAYHTGEDEGGRFLQIDAGDWNFLSQTIHQAKAAWDKYFNSVEVIASGLDLASEDWRLVNQIRDLIIDNFHYNVTDSSMMDFLYSQTGQCYHYAKLFEDLCQSVGVAARIAADHVHAWNEVIFNGITYIFDATHAQATGNVDAYSWQAA